MRYYSKKIIQIILLAALSNTVFALDDGPRMYWNAPVGLNILQTYAWFAKGNSITANGEVFDADIDVDMELLLLGYNHIFDLFGHSSIFTTMLTAGSASADVLDTYTRTTRGVGDIYFQGTINLIGAPALSSAEFAHYEQKTVLTLLLGVSAPTGNYDAKHLLNMGANRWGLRVGMPFVQSFGPWVPGEITTLEILPSAWFFSTNDEFIGTIELTQEPLFTLETHLTHDLTTRLYGSLDYFLQAGGETSLDGARQGDAQNSSLLGATLGYQLNDQFQILLRYMTSLNPDPEKTLDVDIVQLNLNYIW